MTVCVASPEGSTFASSLIAYIDCQSRTIGERGFLALAAPGSSVSQFIGVLLTVMIAVFGYRLILGANLTVREGVMTIVKVGAVFTFATGWPAYQAVFYNVVIMTPGELASTIGDAAGLPGAAGDLPAHLDAVDQQFQQLSIYNVTRPFVAPIPGTVPPPLFAGFDVFALGAARVMFLVGAIGGFTATRLIAGLLLALGPLFISFALFDATRGLVEGWIKMLIGAALGTFAISIILSTELALLEPWLSRLITIRGTNVLVSNASVQLLATTMLFVATLVAAIAVAARLTLSLRAPTGSVSASILPLASQQSRQHNSSPSDRGLSEEMSSTRSRARKIAAAVAAVERREAAALASVSAFDGEQTLARRLPEPSFKGYSAVVGENARASPVVSRRIEARISAAAQRRDQKR